MLRECTCAHIAELEHNTKHFKAAACLVDPFVPRAATFRTLLSTLGISRESPEARNLVFMTSRIARINAWETCFKSDIVLVRCGEEYVGEV